ncbi:MAG: hypothetical protein E7182_00560 [Erysipelotrichaceae bacterium]|nr:hypothetical protein [Erysipelotrichaceae bacterium]
MHYRPFRFVDFPKVRAALDAFPVDFSTQRNTKNLRYFDGVAMIDLVVNCQTVTCVFDISGDEIDVQAHTPAELKALRYLLEQLNEADRIDKDIAFTNVKTLFETNRTFRYLHQMYGGKRYVALCRDLIDKNMDVSLYPYMYEDIVLGVFTSYNKNASRDTAGLFEGIVGMLADLDLSSIVLKNIFSGIGAKSSPGNYREFVSLCLAHPKLRPTMKEFVVDGYAVNRYDGRMTYPQVDVATLLSFDHDDLCELFRGLPGGMKDLVRELFDALGKDADADYVRAYLHNPSRDMSVLTSSRAFASFPADVKREINRGKAFSASAKPKEIIAYYSSLEDEESKQGVLSACEDFGQVELAKALRGEDFLLPGFSIGDIEALLPFIDLETPKMVSRLSAYLTQYGFVFVRSESLENILLSLKSPSYKSLIRVALNKNMVLDQARRLCLADRFGLLPELGYQEWRYHA